MQNKSETKVYSFDRFLSVKKQVAESIPTSKHGTHTQEEGAQQASWQRPSALQKTKGSSGTLLQVRNLQIQHLEQERRKWQKKKGHKRHCSKHTDNALWGLPELDGKSEEVYISHDSGEDRYREMLFVLFS